MSRFAALLGPDAPRTGADQRTEAAWRVEADLARRMAQIPDHRCGGDLHLWQTAGPDDGRGTIRSLGPLMLAGDLGLTDLPELRGALVADPAADAAGLILAAWARWGEDALPRLNGAFAFVIWDARTRRLTAVRDRFGVRPLVHAATGDGAIIAGDLSTALAALENTPEINREWAADYLAGQALSDTATAWRDVYRLPPGHLLTIGPDGVAASRAWYRLERSAPPDTGGDRDAALRAVLAHATAEACAASPTATLLSGGLDSSALSLLSVLPGAPRPLPRPALSLRYGESDMDEGRYIEDVLARADGRLTPVFLPGETTAEDLFDLGPRLDRHDQPVFGPGMHGKERLFRRARDLGCMAVLDGHGGDEVIDGAFWNIAQVAQAGRWPRALSLAVRQARFLGTPVPRALALLLAVGGRRGFGRLGRWALARMEPGEGDAVHDWRMLVDPALARETRLTERAGARTPMTRARADGGGGAGNDGVPEGVRIHAALLTEAMTAAAFETLDRAAQGTGIAPRFPFFDHRVVEHCIWRPDADKIAGGRHRALLRGAMQGILPESVRMRRDKTNFIAAFWANLRADPTGRIAGFRGGPGPLQGLVNEAVLRADAEALAQSVEPNSAAAFRLWRAVWLAAWLERGGSQPRPWPASSRLPSSASPFSGPARAPVPVQANDR